MMYLDLIVLVIIVSLISIWADRRFVRKKREKAAQTAEGEK